jgi:hypothetical protein
VTAILPAVAGALFGVATLLVIQRFSDQAAIRTAKARIRAHLYELRLFGDDPVLMLRANKNLLVWNFRYMRLALTPAAIIAIPAILAALQLDALYGKRSLYEGEAVVVSAQFKTQPDDPVLVAPPSFRVESPSVRIPSLRQVSWRVRALDDSDGMLRLKVPREVVEVPIRAGSGLRYIGDTCTSSFLGLIREGCSIRSDLAESIVIDYPAGGSYWEPWFVLTWLAAMLILRRRFGVTF